MPARRLFSSLIFLAAAFAPLAHAAPPRIGYIFPSLEYDSETSLRWIAAQMESTYSARSFFFAGKDRDQGSSQATPTVIANLNDLDSLDVLVIFTRRMWLNDAQTLKLKNFVNSGKGLVGLRTASHGIQSWSEGRGLDSAVWGGAYNDHGDKTGYTIELTAAAQASPLFAGVEPWRATGGLYRQNLGGKTVASDATIYLYGQDDAGARHPVAWSRVRLGANVFYTSGGTQEDFQKPGFRKMVLNAVYWAAQPAATPVAKPSALTRERGVPGGARNRALFRDKQGESFRSDGRAVQTPP